MFSPSLIRCFIHSPVHGRPGDGDSEDEHPLVALARSSLEATTNPPPTHDGIEELTSCSIPTAFNAEEGPKVRMAEVDPSAVEREAEDQEDRTSLVRRDLELQHPTSPILMTSKSSGRAQTPPTPLTGYDMGRVFSPLLGPEGAELSGRQQPVEAAVNSSSLLPDHHAILGAAYSKF